MRTKAGESTRGCTFNERRVERMIDRLPRLIGSPSEGGWSRVGDRLQKAIFL